MAAAGPLGRRGVCVPERPLHLEKGGVLSRTLLGMHLYPGICTVEYSPLASFPRPLKTGGDLREG